MNITKHILIMWSVIIGVACANPIMIARHKAYMSSEDLTISLDEDYASVVGDFSFKSLSKGEGKVEFILPVWIPINMEDDTHFINRFLKEFPTTSRVRLNATNQVFVTEAISLSVKVDDVAMPFSSIAHFGYDPVYPKENWLLANTTCLLFKEYFNSELVKDGTIFSLSYRQPMLRDGDESKFVYVPIFNNLPESHLETHKEKYRISIQCPKGYELILDSTLDYHESSTSTNLLIIPKHEQPITIGLKRKS